MLQYYRIMRRVGTATTPDDERLQLQELLGTIPGIQRLQINGHRKGGYSVTFELPANAIDQFVLALEADNWMAVL
jgi:hypothetical protein